MDAVPQHPNASPLIGALLVAAALVVTATRRGQLDGFWPWLDGFVRTPGFGALAAFFAAVIAYLTAAQRLKHDREAAEDARGDAAKAEASRRDTEVQAADREQRRQMLMWVYENITTGDPETMSRVTEALSHRLRGDAFQLEMLNALVNKQLTPDTEPDGSTGGRQFEAARLTLSPAARKRLQAVSAQIGDYINEALRDSGATDAINDAARRPFQKGQSSEDPPVEEPSPEEPTVEEPSPEEPPTGG